jgi:hypothetical protein
LNRRAILSITRNIDFDFLFFVFSLEVKWMGSMDFVMG